MVVLGLEQCGVWREKKGVMVVWRCSDRFCYKVAFRRKTDTGDSHRYALRRQSYVTHII